MMVGYQDLKISITTNMEAKITKLLEDLNTLALDYNSYEYGLPTDEPRERHYD